MARILVDMNLSNEWISLLQAAGHEAVHWSDVGDPRAPDMALMEWAVANNYAVFTHDLTSEQCWRSARLMVPASCRCAA